MKRGADNVSPTQALTDAPRNWRRPNHDASAHHRVAEQVNDRASRWLHFGSDEQRHRGHCFAVQMVQRRDPHRRRQKTPAYHRPPAKEHKFTPCIGRSHGIHGEPTTCGLKMALMHDEFSAHWNVSNAPARSSPSQTFRAVGTNAHLSARRGKFCLQAAWPRARAHRTQVVQRDIHAEFHEHARAHGASMNAGRGVRHLQRTEVLEAEEAFTVGQKGSSAMPQAQSHPWERLTGLGARAARQRRRRFGERRALARTRYFSFVGRAHHLPRFLPRCGFTCSACSRA